MSSVVKCNVGKIKRTTYRKFTGSQKSRVAIASMPLNFMIKKVQHITTGCVEANLNPGVAPSLVTGADFENGRIKLSRFFFTLFLILQGNSCFINRYCFAPNETNPNDLCYQCLPNVSESSWTKRQGN